ncbi:MAG: cysteine--tRNA ligase [Bdellovibrionales bacterium]|nr:cysteine--tRNA ligase [Bdellovibrionales bacterium]
MLQFFDTNTNQVQEFVPQDPKRVLMYVCGPTVYDHAHIGHGRAYVSFDVIVRYLRYLGFGVVYARNITDVDDKIIQRAKEKGIDFLTHARAFTESFTQDMDRLGLVRPDIEPKATQTMDEMIHMIQTLIEKNIAYESQGDVYFRVEKFEKYGMLSKKNTKDLLSGARVAKSEIKENPLDFALWKRAKEDEPSWESPWGKGRPGWHIECSAMIKKHLGLTIDIHGGGRDLIFPHHENEIAQSECCNDKTYVKYWMHNGFVTMNEEKMSKSLGNTINLKKLFELVHPEGLKMYFLSSHYRSPIDFSDEDLTSAAKGLDKMYRSMHAIGEGDADDHVSSDYEKRFTDAMNEDFNTAKAIGVLFEIVKEMNKLATKEETLPKARGCKRLLVTLSQSIGLLQKDPQQYFTEIPGMDDIDVEKIESLISKRQQARRERNFALADQIRDEIIAMGILVEDSPEGSTWRKG